ncbi:GNAT family N-acetyltransferase [Amycolatopsis sp. NPDC049252]|uniref:GNAT family N-acetyltransferase n=1 Tax=Amycolatopsis sp. NPDC049252 TaxID=3363933 RepID=UPI00371DA529
MRELVTPTTRLRDAWLEAHEEWGPGVHEDGFGLRPEDDVGSPAGFAAWVARLDGDSGTRYRWIVEDDVVLGGIALRHGSGELVRLAGHIGYGLRPAARGRGLGAWALGRMLGEARSLGLDRVVLVCEAGNTASRKTIEHHGGVLIERGTVLRYRIDLGA